MSRTTPVGELPRAAAEHLCADARWHDALLATYAEFGFCYENSDIPVTPVLLDASVLEETSARLRTLMRLGRHLTLENLQDRAPIRQDHRAIVELSLEAERRAPMGRPDCILAGGTMKILELNIDSGMGGIQEVDELTSAYLRSGLADLVACSLQSPFESQIGFIRDQLAATEKQSVCLVPLADFSRFYLDQTDFLASEVNRRLGVLAKTVFPEALRRGEWLTDGENEYGLFYRDACFLHEPIILAGMAEAIRGALSTRTVVLSDPFDIGVDDKGGLALISEFLDQRSPTDPEFGSIKEMVPWTRLMDRKVTTTPEGQVDLARFVSIHKNSLVLKRCTSHVGKQVFIGNRTDDAIWDDIISRTMLTRENGEYWVVQEFIAADRLPLWFRTREGELVLRRCGGTIGPFMFGDQTDGWLVRVPNDDASDGSVLALPTDGNMGITTVAAVNRQRDR
jgi:hypothetical protein